MLLCRLYIQNFALVDRLEIELHPGFNVLTGETGAGKSIIIDAVDIVTGGQGLTEFIRSGEEKALVEGFFEIAGNAKIINKLTEYGLLPEAGEPLVLARELVKSGKNLCRVNGRQVTLSVYKDIAGDIVDIYGQHHQQSLLDPQKHIELLDEYGGSELLELKEKVAAAWYGVSSLQTKLKSVETDEKDRARTSDMYSYQLEEIEQCQLKIGEDNELEEEKNILFHAEKLTISINSAYQALYEGGRQNSITDQLSEVINSVRDASIIDQSLEPIRNALESALYQLEESAREIKSYSENLDADPDRLEVVETRINTIKQLKKKYGETIEEILVYRDQVSASLDVISNYDKELAALKEAVDIKAAEYEGLAGLLSAGRREAAKKLENEVTGELKELSMPHVSFQTAIGAKNVPGPAGKDEVEFLISPNKGEPLKPLARIVSGGEVSRIMLAFKTTLARIDSVSTMIFDEVDAGIGGNALLAVAQKLSQVGQDRQVICVTHSPQIAGRGSHHYHIVKAVENERTVTRVVELSFADRIVEIARLLAGGKVTDVAKTHAEEILNQSLA